MRAETTGSAGRGERQLVDDHARELLAGHVDALPEGRGREQHGVRRARGSCSSSAARGASPWISSGNGDAPAIRSATAFMFA